MNETNEVYVIECSKGFSIIYYKVFFEKREIKTLLKDMVGLFGDKMDRVSVKKVSKETDRTRIEMLIEINDISVVENLCKR